MKKILTLNVCLAICLICSLAYGQKGVSSSQEHLKCFRELIGNWEHKGPATEDLEGIVKKDQQIHVQISYRWVLDRNAVEVSSTGEVLVEGGFKVSAKGMIGWDPSRKQLMEGSLFSTGGYNRGLVTYDEKAKTFTWENRGVDGTGESFSDRTVLTIKDKDTIVIQSFDRTGSWGEGDGAALTYKRLERQRTGRKRKQAK